MLSSAISSTKADVSTCLQMFNEYMFLWQSDRDEVIKEFLETNPILSEFKAEIDKYQELEEKINAIPEKFRIGNKALQLNSEPVKLALVVEAQNWKTGLGRCLNIKYRDILEDSVSFVQDYSRRLQ